ncbi:MAG: DNA polymerase I [Spirochaetales bacterium]|nr:DNA polymerase I [Spirochaetales bacterium]MCP5486543.1 DNA polymerase I [Spirochaetales bacterium]
MPSRTGLMIVDAHAMAYRAYYALQGQNLTHALSGQPIAAIFGFFRMFFKLLNDYSPAGIAVVWDPPGGHSFRNDAYVEYKANRKPMPDELRSQIEEIKALLRQAGFAHIEVAGYEADDVMGALARRFGSRSPVLLITGDKDCYQLLSGKVRMLRGSRGVTEFTEIGPAWVKEELGVTVKQIPDYMGLVGDSTDNIPGARGVGPKSAAKLLEEFKTIKGLYKNIDKVTPAGLRKKLVESRENVELSRDLATIRTEIPEVDEMPDETFVTPDYLAPAVLQVFRKEGYNQIYADLLKARGDAPETAAAPKADRNYRLVSDVAGLEKMETELRGALKKSPVLSVDTETDHVEPVRARLVGISLCARAGHAFYIPVLPENAGPPEARLRESLQSVLGIKGLRLIGQNLKYDIIVLERWGLSLPAPSFDTMIGSYLLNPNTRRHSLDDQALDLLGIEKIKYASLVGTGKKQVTMADLSAEQVSDYACEDADVTYQIFELLEKRIAEADLVRVNEEIELRLIPVLVAMERAGVAIDAAYFRGLSSDYEKRLAKLEKQIFEAVGHSFNISSTRELQTVLFEELKLPHGKRTKTGYSTDQKVLEELRSEHTMVNDLLEHRKYSKLKSTYVDTLPELVNEETGRIHTSFNQTIAATGRLSSVDPNLQNIPIREETGRAIRRGFIAASGNRLLSLDYSQIELRIMAHYSEDSALTETFVRDDLDIHARTASSIFAVPEGEVTADMRSRAKAVNFSIIYGVTEFGLARNLGIDRPEARHYIDQFFARYPGVRRYMDNTIEFARENGFVRTLSGRIRQIPDIKSSNRFRREGAERTAINTPIQGTSADIIKLAMIKIGDEFTKRKLRSQLILQVHDELLFDVQAPEEAAVVEIAVRCMEDALPLSVPLRVEYRFGQNWDEAH